MSHSARLYAYGAVSTALALHSDHALRELVDAATPLGVGIGGKSAALQIDGIAVFVKRIPLTDLERQPEHLRSTANLFACRAMIRTCGSREGAPSRKMIDEVTGF